MFLEILFRPYNFGLHVAVDTIRVFFVIADFLAESLKASKN